MKPYPPILMRDVWGATHEPDEPSTLLDEDGWMSTQPCRELHPEERAAINLDCDRQAYRAGVANAQQAYAIYGLEHLEDYATRIQPWTSQPHWRGFADALNQIRREHLEAVQGICADCETPLENGVCLRCIEG